MDLKNKEPENTHFSARQTEELSAVPVKPQRVALSPWTSPIVVGAISIGLMFFMCFIVLILILFSLLDQGGH